MQTQAPIEFIDKIRAAIISWDPTEVESIDELAVQKAAYYIAFGSGHEDQLHNITDGYVYGIYDIIKFVEPFQASCGHQAYKQVIMAIACGEMNCNNYIH